MKVNVARSPIHTHEGAVAQHINAEQQLRRSVMACLLWEDEFYESGEEIAKRIAGLIAQVDPEKVAAIAIEARGKMKLRHVPLLIVREMARLPQHKKLVAATLSAVVQRADELHEFLAIYWKDGRQKVSAQVKKGLAAAFPKFDEYALAKYNGDGVVKLRDVLFICHAKPKDAAQAEMWKRLIASELKTPDTWEVALSGGENKKETFERLMSEGKLFALAFLRNLRNMEQSGVSKAAVAAYATTLKTERVLPFRFITAARIVPQWEDVLEPLMMKCLGEQPKLPGRTVLLLDVSGSMDAALSAKARTTRMDAGFGLGVLLREVCEQVEIFTFSELVMRCAPRRGFALRDEMESSQPHGGTYLAAAVKAINVKVPYDRLIVITDEQAHDGAGMPTSKGYMINVASNKNGVGYGAWTHIDGWSEAVVDYIREAERQEV